MKVEGLLPASVLCWISVVGKIPLGRPGTLDEIAKVVSFLASGESSYITGIELVVDGGMTQI